ncbi:ATP-dependent endonuclease [Chloroflexota bacterium]
MWISRAALTNVRSFEKADVNLSKGINVLVGANNSGKSTIIHAVSSIQTGGLLQQKDRRIRTQNGNVELILQDDTKKYLAQAGNVYNYILKGQSRTLAGSTVNEITAIEPDNFIYPYLSKRKTAGYNEQIKEEFANAVRGNFQHLYAKVDRITNPEFLPAHDSYIKACDDILGFRVTTVPSSNGKKAAYIIRNMENIPLEVMGEGVANIVGLLVDLCVAEGKLFLIEEPENDIHPKALKSLLLLIKEKSDTNQFIVTTHSHIETKYLGSNPNSKVFEVKVSFEDKIPTSRIEEVDSSVESRRNLLESLGYELIDVDMWDS